jgi:hypothetical protein
MAGKSPVEIGPAKFDLETVKAFAIEQPYIFWGVIAAMFLFWVARKNGMLGLLLDYKKAKDENFTRRELGRQALIRKFGSVEGPSKAVQALPEPGSQPPSVSKGAGVQATASSEKRGRQSE